jgi:ubiquinol-cytochrome c reductase iron-sulfur subunit
MSETLANSGQIDSSKRTWLIASSCAGAVGGLAVAVPFVVFNPPKEQKQRVPL